MAELLTEDGQRVVKSSSVSPLPDIFPRPEGVQTSSISLLPENPARDSKEQKERSSSVEEDEQHSVPAFDLPKPTILYQGIPSNHYNSLANATMLVLIYIVNVITDGLLAAQYVKAGFQSSAAFLVLWHILAGFVEALLDLFSNGTLKFLPFHMLRVQIILDYVEYVKVWRTKKGKRWSKKDFYGNYSFNTAPFVFPSLMIQTFVIFLVGFESPVQFAALVVSAIHAMFDLFHYYKYLSLRRDLIAWQMVKGVFNTAIRTAVGAFIIARFQGYLVFAMAFSFAFGFSCYVFLVWNSRARKRDDPIKFKRMHLVQATIVAVIMLFVPVPFAPNHAIADWWFGYLIADTKLNVENGVLLAILMSNWDIYYSRKDVYYAVCFLSFSCMVSNFILLKLMDNQVLQYLQERQIYSSQPIVRHFATWGKYYRDVLHVKRKKRLLRRVSVYNL